MLTKCAQWKQYKTFLIVILCTLSFGVYLNSFRNEFTYDDRDLLLDDHRIRSVRSLPALLTNDYWMVANTNLYRPLPMLSFAVNYLISGESPWSYRLFNQLLHTLNVVLIFIFLGNFYQDRLGLRFLAAAIFAVHPAATESVNLIVGRAELFAFAFSLASFHLYIHKERGMRYRFGSLLLFFFAMLSKENAMMLPLFLLLYHVYFDRCKPGTLVKNLLGYGAALIVFIGIRWEVIGAFGPQGSGQIFNGVSRESALLTMVKAVAHYWQVAFWPSGIQVNYDFNDIPIATSLLDARVIVSLALLTAVAAAIALFFRKNGQLSFFMLWPLIALILVMNIIVPTGVLFAIRLMYLPMLGYSVLLATLLFGLSNVMTGNRSETGNGCTGFRLVIGAYLVALAVVTISRNTDWKNNMTLFKKELALSPRSNFAMVMLTGHLPPEEAEAMLGQALNSYSSDARTLETLAHLKEKKGDLAAAENLLRQSLALSVNQPNAKTHHSLGILLSRSGRLDEAEQQLRRAIQLKPFWSTAYENLAIVQLKKGERKAAFAMIQEAVRINPGSAQAYNLLGTYYEETGAHRDAVAAFRKAVALSPQFYDALYNLANACEKVDRGLAVTAWQTYLTTAASIESEAAWVADARRRLVALSQ